MKTKTKKRLKRIIIKPVKQLRRLFAKKKLVKKRASHRLLRTFFILVVTASIGSLFLTAATIRPTVDPALRAQIKTRSININTTSDPLITTGGIDQVGQASWYALGLRAPDSQTCASTTFPRGSYLQVTNLRNRRTVVCLVNDYGPEAYTRRVIDLSRGSFVAIEDLGRGTTPVEIRVVPRPIAELNLALPTSFSQLTGYGVCHTRFTKEYCEGNRQISDPLQ